MAGHATLRRRMILNLSLMVLSSFITGVGSVLAVNGLHEDLGSAVQGYRQLRQLFSVGFFVSRARDAVTSNPPSPQQVIISLQAALNSLNDRSAIYAVEGAPRYWIDESARRDCAALLSQSIYEVSHDQINAPSLNLLFPKLLTISESVRQSIVDVQNAAERKHRIILWTIVSSWVLVVMGAILIGVRQYKIVLNPLRELSLATTGFAKGDFTSRIHITADAEFLSLADDFNYMANELSAIYRNLEQKVQEQSRELIRSERLASVGYLASGVAHEINNPLSIIAGYAERVMQQAKTGVDHCSNEPIEKAMTIICEEAFRCKQITERLLSLARPGSDDRQVFSISAIAESMVSILRGLGLVGTRELKISYDPILDLSVVIDEGEFKQVLLNLIINALEAVNMDNGKVAINISRVRDDICLTVTDNGTGMAAETLDRIFQPFFTTKRGERPGTGLGLSIAYSIVTDHGGTLSANSQGLTMGSTFTIQLPGAKKEVVVAVRHK